MLGEFMEINKLTRIILVVTGLSILCAAFVYAGGGTNGISMSLTVPNSCTFSLNSNTAIAFGSISSGTNTIGTSNVIAVTNSGANPSNIFTDGNNWASGGNNFGVANTFFASAVNTLYNPVANTLGYDGYVANVEVELSTTQLDTLTQVTAGATGHIWYGVAVPSGQIGGSYAQTTNVISSC